MRLLYDRKQPYYCEVEYLESTGYEAIDTGILFDANKNMRYQVKATSLSTDRAIIGSSYASSSYSAYGLEFGGSSQSGAIRVYYNTSGNATSEYTESLPINVPRTIDCNYVAADNKIYFSYDGNTPVEYSVQNGSLQNNRGVRLFLDWRTSSVSNIRHPIRIYYFRIIKDNTLVLDLIPVLDLNKVPCMYDKVSGQLLYNDGTGAFLYGREIHPVEYIKGTGTQFFSSGISTAPNIIFEATIKKDDSIPFVSTAVCGSLESGTVSRCQIIFSNEARFSARIKNGTTTINVSSIYDIHTVKLDVLNNKLYVDDVSANLSSQGSGSLNTNDICFFARGQTDMSEVTSISSMYFYGGKVWYDETLMGDFIPAIDETGKAFSFDKVEHTIHDNIGTGKFLHGKVENTSGLRLLYTDNNNGSNKKYILRFIEGD